LRIAALAFGVVAGLIASLILALGGLDIAVGPEPDRQIQITRFALFILANIGVFGAGLVLASPFGAAILFVIGAVAWVAAALLLHHGPDLVLIVPPALLAIATIFSLIAFFGRSRGFNLPPLTLGRRNRTPEPAPRELDDLPPVPVGAGFFGSGGTGQPLRNGGEPNVGGLDERDRPPVDWTPGRRRPPPPRQQPMFRPPDDEYEESGFSRFARGASSVLSFGLYAAVAGALLLVFWNARGFDKAHPAAAKLEPASVAAASVPALPASSAPPSVAVADLQPSAPPAEAGPSIPPQLMNGVVVADSNGDVPFEAPRNVLDAALAPPTQTTASTSSAAAGPPPADDAGASSAETGTFSDQTVVMPFPMPPEIAASRAGPSSRAAPARTTPAQPAGGDTGL
jgi:hypothetical protein